MTPSTRQTPVHRALTACLALASVGVFGVVLADSAARIGTTMPGFLVWSNGVLVSLHRESWTGAQARLPLNGGVLVEVEGRPFPGGPAFVAEVAERAPGEVLEYGVRIDGRVERFSVPSMRLGGVDWALTLGNYLLNGFGMLLVATLALLLRPDQMAPRALALGTASVGLALVLVVDYVGSYRFVHAARLAESLMPAALMHLALVFPRRRLSNRAHNALVGALGFGFVAAQTVASFTYYAQPELARGLAEAIYVASACAVLALLGNYFETLLRASDADQRTRAAVLCVGGMPAIGMASFGILAFTLLGWSFSWAWVFLLMPLAPLSMLYAMLAQDLFNADRVVRLAVGYGLSTGTVMVAYAAGVAALDLAMMSGAPDNPAGSFMLLLLIVLAFDPVRRRIQSVVDRTFYRSPPDFTAELARASADILTLRSEDEICDYALRQLQEELQLTSARLRRADDAPGAAVLQHPVEFRGQRFGVLECGVKRSGTSFSPAERAFVASLADQTALAIHNVRTLVGLRQAEEQLGVQTRLAAVGEFAGAVAHGIRNPLAGIRAGVEAAEPRVSDPFVKETLGQVRAEANRLEQRIHNLLSFSEPYALRRSSVDLCELVQEVAQGTKALANRSGVEISTDLPAKPVFCDVDADYLTLALLELAKNGIEAMPDGGRLRLELAASDSHVHLGVRDSGAGLPADHVERIFDLFFTTRPEGTGVGLASVRKIVDAHGAEIQIEEEDGTAFVIHFTRQ